MDEKEFCFRELENPDTKDVACLEDACVWLCLPMCSAFTAVQLQSRSARALAHLGDLWP